MALDAGRLYFTLEFGRNLKNRDILGRMDPYAIVTCGGITRRTQTNHRGGRDPVWNETFTFPVLCDNTVHVEVCDEDTCWDDRIGCCQVELSKVRVLGKVREQVPIISPKSHRQHGYLCVTMTFVTNRPVDGPCAATIALAQQALAFAMPTNDDSPDEATVQRHNLGNPLHAGQRISSVSGGISVNGHPPAVGVPAGMQQGHGFAPGPAHYHPPPKPAPYPPQQAPTAAAPNAAGVYGQPSAYNPMPHVVLEHSFQFDEPPTAPPQPAPRPPRDAPHKRKGAALKLFFGFKDVGKDSDQRRERHGRAQDMDPAGHGGSGTYPSMSGAYPSMGGAYPSMSGAYPSMGGAYPGMNGGYPSVNGGYPSMGGLSPQLHAPGAPGYGATGSAPWNQDPGYTQGAGWFSPWQAGH